MTRLTVVYGPYEQDVRDGSRGGLVDLALTELVDTYCPTCGGKGVIEGTAYEGYADTSLCPDCKGSGTKEV